MKKIILALLVLGILAVVGLPVFNLVAGGPSGTALTTTATDDAKTAEVAAILEKKCANCHVPDVAPPFYAALPVASSMVHADIDKGLTYINLVEGLFPGEDQPPNEAALAMIERIVLRDEMPPTRFVLLHWNSGLSDVEKETILSQIKAVRVAAYAPKGIPDALRASVIHPIPASTGVDPRKAELGRALYHDVRLSVDDTISCASCHDLAKGGTDQEKVSTGVRDQKGGINAPTTFNSQYQIKMFWDGRAPTLEAQADGPPNNPVEMGSNWELTFAKLNKDETFAAQFKAVYPEGFTKETITSAIADFERTLNTPNSPFDKYLEGNEGALSADAKKGYEKFIEVGCATCHSGKLLGGNSFQPMGRTRDYFKDRGGEQTDADLGLFNVTKREHDKHHFKVPTLRNIALTFPYFHDGSAADLTTAVDEMARYQYGLELSDVDEKAIVAFLESLTGEYQGKSL